MRAQQKRLGHAIASRNSSTKGWSLERGHLNFESFISQRGERTATAYSARSRCSTALQKNCSVFKGKNAGVRPPLTLTFLPYSQLYRLRTSPSELRISAFSPLVIRPRRARLWASREKEETPRGKKKNSTKRTLLRSTQV